MRAGRTIAAGAISLASAIGGLASLGATSAAAYGNTAVHQVEISAMIDPNLFGPGTGGGIWLWIELDGTQSGGDGDYTGSDCLHHTPIAPVTGAVPDRGDVQWSLAGSIITITGVVIGGDQPITITVPESGHLNTSDLSTVFSAPVGVLPGTAKIQVAP